MAAETTTALMRARVTSMPTARAASASSRTASH